MKKIISMFIVVAMGLISVSGMACASDLNVTPDQPMGFSQTVNMYDYYEEKYNELTSGIQLMNSNGEALSAEEVNFFLTYRERLADNVERLASYTDAQLDFLGYTEAQKYAIRNFDGTDKMLRATASSITVEGKFEEYTILSSGTTAKLVVTFEWNGEYSPGGIFSSEDIFGIGWDSPFQLKSQSVKLTYINADRGSRVITYLDPENKEEVLVVGNYANGYIIPNHESSTTGGGTVIGHWINSGRFELNLKTLTEKVETVATAAYGYNTKTATPSISVSTNGDAGFGFSFSDKVEMLGAERIYWPEEE